MRRAATPTFDLAPGGVCQAVRVTPGAGALLPHRFTLTCGTFRRPSAVCFLWHFPAGHPDWPLTSTLPYGVPTFLEQVQAWSRSLSRLTVTIHASSGRTRHFGVENGHDQRSV